MPIPDGLRRLWRWARHRVQPTRQPVTLQSAAAAPSPSHDVPATGARAAPAGGEILVAGALTVRMWVVGGLLVLSAFPQETERTLARLLDHADATVRLDAQRALAAVARDRAAAA